VFHYLPTCPANNFRLQPFNYLDVCMSNLPSVAIEEFMQRDLELISETTSAIEAAAHMADKRIGCLVVQGKGSDADQQPIIGLLSETDLVRKVMATEQANATTPVGQIMSNQLQTIASHRSMLDASHVMEQQGVRHLCVADGEEIVGLISIRDLVRYFVYAESGPIRELDNVYRPLSVLMQTSIETIDSNLSVWHAAQQMAAKKVGALLVQQDGELKGIVTERDLVQKVLSQEKDANLLTVKAVMNHPLIDIDINRTIHDASDLMADKWIRHLPVTENRKIVGILSVRDLIRMIAVRDRPRFLRQK
jgi:signal-transduction protein with cAMP-binding, CBS, and nucleotidyltransferase domain